MKKLVLSVCAVALVAVSAFGQTADELIDKNVKAMGGAEKLKALQSVKMTGKMKMGPMEAPFSISKARPEQVRIDFTIQGMTGTQAYDGSTGWLVMPFMGKKEPEKMSEDMLKDFRDEADFDGPMMNYQSKGNKVEYLGKGDVQGSPAYKLKVTTKQGNESIVYLDAETYLTIKSEGKRKIQGQEVETETTIGDYKDVDGMMFPYSIESHAKGREQSQAIVIEKVELNPKLDAALFKMPEAKKEEAPAEVKKQ